MVYKYIRKTTQGQGWDEATMQRAIEDSKTESINSVAKKYGIPFATLYRHRKSNNAKTQLGRYRIIFTQAQELELANYIKEMDSIFYGLTRHEFKVLVFTYANQNNIPHPFKNGMAGDQWLKGFQTRHPEIVLRSPEPTSVARARGFNRPQVERFYDHLSNLLDSDRFTPSRIYNMDETGIHTTTNKPPKILSICGKKQVGVIASAERGVLTTAICCCNAAGGFIPPYLIFARKRMKDSLLDGAPPGTQGSCTDNGWINGETFLLWLKFFQNEVRASPEHKVILLLDNHESHKYYPALEYASANNIIFLSFAPHTTHRMQPLDITVYGPIKTYFEQSVSSFQKAHAGRIINQADIAKLFCPAYLKGATTNNAVSGFVRPGIYPFNRDAFDDSDYVAASVTDRPLPQEEGQTNGDTVVVGLGAEVGIVEPNRPKELQIVSDLQPVVVPPSTPNSDRDKPSTSGTRPAANPVSHISPSEIRPVPKCPTQQPNARKRKLQRSEILTSTPIKKDQASKLAKKNIKEEKKEVKKKTTTKARPQTKPKKALFQSHGSGNAPKSGKSLPDHDCLVCGEKYSTSLANEDWIQCSQCRKWAHELCTSYLGYGSYFCDECDD